MLADRHVSGLNRSNAKKKTIMPPAPTVDIRESQRALRQRFGLLLLATGLPIVLLILVVAWQNYRQAHAASLVELDQAIAARRAGLSELASSARTHVAVMRSFSENRLVERSRLPGYSGPTDWPGSSVSPGAEYGIVLSPPGAMGPADRQELSAIDPLFSLSRAAHKARPFLRWSYYFSASKTFVTIFPWADASAFLSAPDPRAPSPAISTMTCLRSQCRRRTRSAKPSGRRSISMPAAPA